MPAPAVPKKKRPTTASKAATKNASPTKSLAVSATDKEVEYGAVGGMEMAAADEGVGGSGEELAQTLEKVVS